MGRRLADQAAVPVTRVGSGADADVRVLGWRTGAAGTEVLLQDDAGGHRGHGPLVGRVHVTNLAAAWATGRVSRSLVPRRDAPRAVSRR